MKIYEQQKKKMVLTSQSQGFIRRKKNQVNLISFSYKSRALCHISHNDYQNNINFH